MADALVNVHLAALALEALGTGAAVHLGRVGAEAAVDALFVVADGAADGRVLLLLDRDTTQIEGREHNIKRVGQTTSNNIF